MSVARQCAAAGKGQGGRSFAADGVLRCTIISRAQNTDMANRPPSVLVVDDNPVRAAIIEAGLREAGHDR